MSHSPKNISAINATSAFLLFLVLLISTPNASAQDIQSGVLLPKIATTQNAAQSYALYLPSNYSPAKQWPIVYAFDPAARGASPVELMQEAAEKYGYIVAGSNNSRNGSGQLEAEAAQAMLQDTHARLSIDDRRMYFAGFSGGARLSAELAQHCACAAGVILAGAGFQPDARSSHDSFAVFSAIGSYDFNYGEMIALDENLQTLNAPHFLRRFEGPHQWPSAAIFTEALAWLRLQAMKSGRVPRDAAWFEYRQAAESLDNLADASQLQSRQKALHGQKAVLDAAKREKQEIRDQEYLSAGIFRGFAELSQPNPNDTAPPATARNELRNQILALQARSGKEKVPSKARVVKRALAGIFVDAMETGRARQDAHDATHARDYFEMAIAADPDSVWALTSLSVARAADGDKKAAFEALRRTRQKWTDRQAFTDWLNSQPAFAKFRDAPEFHSLLE